MALDRLELAYEEAAFGLSLPPLGATWRAPLVWSLDPRSPLELIDERVASRGFDRGRTGCQGGALSAEVARRCVLGAHVVRQAPAAAPWLRDGYAADLSLQLGAAPEASASAQTSLGQPEVGVLTTSVGKEAQLAKFAGAGLRSSRFFGYLDRRSRGRLGEAGFLALSMAATRTSAGALRWDGDPDLVDVLSASVGGDRRELSRIFDDFAQDSFRDAGVRGAVLGIDWEMDAGSLPRSVAFSRGWEPTGSGYLRLRFPEALRQEVVAFRASCEAPVSYVWSVARLDGDGQEISRFPLTFQERGGSASGRVLPQMSMESLLLVGTNVGGVDLAHPFDPDHGPHEAHRCTVSINVVDASAQSPKNQ